MTIFRPGIPLLLTSLLLPFCCGSVTANELRPAEKAASLPVASPTAIEAIDFTVLKKLPHSRSDFVQGLEIRDQLIYQGTGISGQSGLQIFRLSDGEKLGEIRLPPPLFGEGITVFNDHIIQLTWQNRKAIVYRREDLQPLQLFDLPGEGWGVTHDGERLIYSDGSDQLRYITPGTWQISAGPRVTRNGRAQANINELEWTPQGLFANIWQTDTIVRIDPDSGAVTGEINLAGLLPLGDRTVSTNVLNGIAYNADDGTFWVTGKNWPWLYQLRLLGPQ